MHRRNIFLSVGCICALFAVTAYADFKDDIGYTQLQSELGGSTPDGTGVVVSQVEYGQANTWTELLHLTYEYPTGFQYYSDHASGTATYFVGDTTSIAPGVSTLLSYDYCGFWYAATYSCGHANSIVNAPAFGGEDISGGVLPGTDEARVGNHSYLISLGSGMVRRLDWYIATDDAIEFVGMNNDTLNGSASSYSLPIAFNHIAVGRSSGEHGVGANTSLGYPDEGETLYVAGHARPTIVDPGYSTSLATPISASVGVLLVQTGHDDAGLSTDPSVQSFTNRSDALIRNAERSEVIKAAIMAGADRTTRFTDDDDSWAYLRKYRDTVGHRTANGLDTVLGAGQINVHSSYYIIAAGEQNSHEDDNNWGAPDRGFDYDPSFGGSNGSNSEANYFFEGSANTRVLTASLVWNMDIVGDGGEDPDVFDGTATLHDLKLSVFDITGEEVVVASSDSTDENTENIWFKMLPYHEYVLRVNRGHSSSAFEWDYGIAWQALPDADGDGAPDEKDNCINVANGPLTADNGGHSQLDTDNDGYGNRCDPDLNNSGLVTSADYTLFYPHLNTSDELYDFNGSGLVTSADYTILYNMLNGPPGPSAYAP